MLVALLDDEDELEDHLTQWPKPLKYPKHGSKSFVKIWTSLVEELWSHIDSTYKNFFYNYNGEATLWIACRGPWRGILPCVFIYINIMQPGFFLVLPILSHFLWASMPFPFFANFLLGYDPIQQLIVLDLLLPLIVNLICLPIMGHRPSLISHCIAIWSLPSH